MGEKHRIVIAEDHTILREGLRALLSSDPDLEIVGEAEDGQEAIRCVERLKPGLVFGGTGSGEGISSKRTAGGNQFGLDFYTGFNARLSIDSAGRVGIGTTAPSDSNSAWR